MPLFKETPSALGANPGYGGRGASSRVLRATSGRLSPFLLREADHVRSGRGQDPEDLLLREEAIPGRREEAEDRGGRGVLLTGKYDIVTILDAPGLESVLKLSTMMAASGRTRNETYSAVSADEFERI